MNKKIRNIRATVSMRSIETVANRGTKQVLPCVELNRKSSALGPESKYVRKVPQIRVCLHYGKNAYIYVINS